MKICRIKVAQACNAWLWMTACVLSIVWSGVVMAQQKSDSSGSRSQAYANELDKASEAAFQAREKDWRNGAVVYQVIVDRFVPSANLEAKKSLYAAPKALRNWNEVPTRGKYLENAKFWSHEIDFWGGDLQSTMSKLDYVRELGADVLYLNPIHLGYTNHKYDALDYQEISPEYGTHADFKALTQAAHQQGMKVVLDGVFNHMGRNSPKFKDAQSNPKSPYRDWFYFSKDYPGGARAWMGAENLLELNLENPAVRDHLYAKPDSVVQRYLSDGVDGWRLDTAFELGFKYLDELTQAAHARKPGSLVVGEIVSYPREWFPSLDAVMNFTLRQIILRMTKGELDAKTAALMTERMITEAGIEPMLKSWVLLDNHDLDRLKSTLPDEAQRRLAQVLQFTLPSSPNLYYGSEIDMEGVGDPGMRAPMRWDWVTKDNRTLAWTKQLIALHQQHRALRIGNFRPVNANKLFAFERYTNRAEDTIVVIANPTDAAITESVMIANSKLMNSMKLTNVLDTSAQPAYLDAGFIRVTLPAHGALVLKADTSAKDGYSAYKRVQ